VAASVQCRKVSLTPYGHHPTTLSGYIFATKACIDNRKKHFLSSNISSTCPHNMVNFSPIAAEICWRVWGTPANFNGFHVMAALLHVIPVFRHCGAEQRAPPLFGRAAITLGIGPHSSFCRSLSAGAGNDWRELHFLWETDALN